MHCLHNYWLCYKNDQKKKYPQVYLEECKYKIKKIQTPRFIITELESDSDPEAEAEAESENDTVN